ncbi:hypothetical protein D3OALGA1CA_5564 [Olavius algarvensis associated proteobacterium Delta 3]|nr:hypothetical protein D3OALGB2SA_5120 [Olavius algarvensis associated proteobacterium Delta 3]CAB5168548.1 hypothetical protein D3OALGA1CA_5564 [Olavius algarvensis associated proteobacterium Delta 3]
MLDTGYWMLDACPPLAGWMLDTGYYNRRYRMQGARRMKPASGCLFLLPES